MYEALRAENREAPVVARTCRWCLAPLGSRGGVPVGGGPWGERFGGNPSMNDHGKSDGPVVPAKPLNKLAVMAGAEVVEGRGPAKGNTASEARPGRSAGQGVSSDLDRVRQVAREDKDVRFTALLHHVSVDRLREAYRAIQPGAAPGVDGV